MSLQNQIVLKHLQLYPSKLRIHSNEPFTLKISYDNHHSYSSLSNQNRKFFFLIKELDEQIGPLQENSTFQMEGISQIGTYNLICTNYPKISAIIQVVDFNRSPDSLAAKLEEVKQEQRQQQLKNQNEQEQPLQDLQEKQLKQEFDPSKSLFSNSNSFETINIPDYDKVLEEDSSESMNHRYLRYFKEQFKLWRNFFQFEETNKQQTPPKKETSLIRPSSAMSNYDISSISNQRSQGPSHMYSHQQTLQRAQSELIQQSRGMKKTNSEYLHNVQHRSQSDLIKTQPENEQTFIDWAISWSGDKKQIAIKAKNDHSLLKQYLNFLHNKFEISKFLHT